MKLVNTQVLVKYQGVISRNQGTQKKLCTGALGTGAKYKTRLIIIGLYESTLCLSSSIKSLFVHRMCEVLVLVYIEKKAIK